MLKTRTLATEACRGGRVQVNGQSVKAAREIKLGDIVELRSGNRHKIYKVLGMNDKRLGAKQAALLYEDQSPMEAKREDTQVKRERGTGRPSKRDRRALDKFRGR